MMRKKPEEEKKSARREKAPPVVNIDFTEIASRLKEVPVPPGNYSSLQATEKRLCWLDHRDEARTPRSICSAWISPTRPTRRKL